MICWNRKLKLTFKIFNAQKSSGTLKQLNKSSLMLFLPKHGINGKFLELYTVPSIYRSNLFLYADT